MASTNTYLDTAVDRLVSMHAAVLATLESNIAIPVLKYVDVGQTAPCMWLFPADASDDSYTMQFSEQAYIVNARLVLGTTETGYDGVLVSKLWTWMPAVVNYFKARRGLQYQAGQAIPTYLIPSKTEFTPGGIRPFGDFTASPQIGIQFAHRLVFNVPNEQVGV